MFPIDVHAFLGVRNFAPTACEVVHVKLTACEVVHVCADGL
jgi:hypothetical protein